MENHARIKIPEEFIHHIWEKQLFGNCFTTESGHSCNVIQAGNRGNRDGPDFESAIVTIDGQCWAGAIEIHIKASDWNRHGHHQDPAYNQVILHVVLENDINTQTEAGFIPPVVVLPYKETSKLFVALSMKKHQDSFPFCLFPELFRKKIIQHPERISSLGHQRMKRKSGAISTLYFNSHKDWRETAWLSIAGAFGLYHNYDPMLWLARITPFKILASITNNPKLTIALLHGQAGFLNIKSQTTTHLSDQQQDYLFLKNKYNLRSMESHHWKQSPVRPSSLPLVRLTQLAAFLPHMANPVELLTHPINLKEKLLETCNGDHQDSKSSKNKYSSFPDLVLINAAVPFLICFGNHTAQTRFNNIAATLIEEIPPEKNKIIHTFVRTAGFRPQNALQSQGLLELHHFYCKHGQCEFCPIKSR